MIEMLLGALIMLLGILVGYGISNSIKNVDTKILDESPININYNTGSTDYTTRHAVFGDYECTLPRIHQGQCVINVKP